jgi:hypothetical protein
MKSLFLLVAVAISTVVSAQKPPRKFIVETSGFETSTFGIKTNDSSLVEYTLCDKIDQAFYGMDTSNLTTYWKYDQEYFDTISKQLTLKEKYVFNLRKGVIVYSNDKRRETAKITGFTFSNSTPYSVEYLIVYSVDKNGLSDSYSLYIDDVTDPKNKDEMSGSFVHYLGSDILDSDNSSKMNSYSGIKITKK